MYPFLKPKHLKHPLKGLRQRQTSVRFGNLDDIQQKRQHSPIVLKVHGPSDEHVVVRRRPCIGCEMETARVISEEFGNPFTAVLVGRLDVASNSP